EIVKVGTGTGDFKGGGRSRQPLLRPAQEIALRVVYSETAQPFDHGRGLGVFRDGDEPQRLAEMIDALDEACVDVIGVHVAHKAAVDLEVVDVEGLEVGKRTDAAAEIVEGDATAQISH